MSKEVKEPAVRMIKRDTISTAKAWGIRLAAVALSLIVAGLVIVAITKQNPIQVYLGIIDGAVGSSRRVWVTIRETLVLLCIAIGLTPAFKMKFWNIGAEGQILMGGMATAALMIYAGDAMPNWLLLILIFVASAAAGLIWGLIPAVFKAYFNTNETLFTLMLNYVAMQLVTFAIVFWENPSGSNTVGIINAAGQKGWFPSIFGNMYGLNVIVVLIITLGMYVYMKYSKQGYEIAVVGESQNTARYAGINVKKVIIRTMMLSGAICGIAGCLIGTLAALTYRTIALSRYMFGNVRPGNAKRSIKKVAVNAAVAAVVLWILGLDGCRAVNYFYVAGIAVLNSLWIAALYLLVNVLTNLEESKDLWKEWNRWLKMRSKR